MQVERVEMDKQFLNSAVVEAIEHQLRESFKTTDFTYKIQCATAKGENYLGIVYRITANDRGNSKKVCYIVKLPPQNQAQRDQFFARPLFLREILAYKEFLPMIDEFQQNKGITLYEKRFHEYADCYSTLNEEFNETIILEDLSQHGYKLFDRFKGIDKEHAVWVMRAYAKLHAISLAIKDQEPEKLEKYKSIVDIFEQRKNNEALKSYFETLKDNALKSLCPQEHSKYYEILKDFFSKNTYFSLLMRCIDSTDCEPYAVICHGDCWNNNFLFLYERHGNVLDLCLIDWQFMRYASPVLDLTYFLFTNTTKEFRRNHYEEMLNTYYSELSEHLLRLGSSPQKVLPRYALEEQLKSKGVFGLLFSMMTLPLITLQSEDTPDLAQLSERLQSGDRTDLKNAGFLTGNTSAYEERIRDVIIDMIDYGYIQND